MYKPSNYLKDYAYLAANSPPETAPLPSRQFRFDPEIRRPRGSPSEGRCGRRLFSEKLRKAFTRALGKPWGRVLLRSVRDVFDKRIAEFRMKLDEHRKMVQAELTAKLEASRQQVVEYLLPAVKVHPPDELVGQLLASAPSDNEMRAWLDGELERVFPDPEDLLSDRVLDVQFRDVTYETLTEKGFAEALATAYPHVNWDKPFDELNAAKERRKQRSRRLAVPKVDRVQGRN
jgi:hypothetical protein